MKGLKEIPNICITTDIWTSSSNIGYLGLTAHGLTEEFDFLSFNLATVELPLHHNAESISSVIKKIFSQFDIAAFGGVTDNGSNIVSAISHLSLLHWNCFAHTLQLCVNDALADQNIQNLLDKCKKLVKYFKKSVVATKQLFEMQESLHYANHKLIKCNNTR